MKLALSLALTGLTLGMSTPALSAAGSSAQPFLVSINPVSPTVVALYVQEGEVERSQLVPYVAQAGDQIIEIRNHWGIKEEYNIVAKRELIRDGKLIGYMSGAAQKCYVTLDHYFGDPVDVNRAESTTTYSIQSDADSAYELPLPPLKVDRKAKPNEFGRHQSALGVRHTIYLRLPSPLIEGRTYSINFPGLGLRTKSVTYEFAPQFQRSEAVHVNQVGFDPADPIKRAYVSLWMGASGGYDFGGKLTYHVVDAVRGERVFSGTTPVFWPATRPDLMYRTDNYTEADVYRLDFAEVSRPGRYYVQVEGVGCSYPFEVKTDTWQDLARLALRGIYHHRSGIALEEPYTDWLRPRPHHPDDGVIVHQSRASLLETTMGMMGGSRNSFAALVEDATDEVLPDAWGGMMDAGDWDRRTQHMIITRWFLEFFEMQPNFAYKLGTNIPESGNDLPDMVDEGLWILDFFMRMQKPDGGVGGGIESAEHPAPGDVSWNEILPVFAYAPDFWSTHTFVATAAHAAYALRDVRPDLAAKYQAAALKGMAWAEKEYHRMQQAELPYPEHGDAVALRRLAALNLYRLTGDETWHQLFVEASERAGHKGTLADWYNAEIEFAYACLPDGRGDPQRKALARQWIVDMAESTLEYEANNAYSIMAPSRKTQMFFGMLAAPVEANHLVRAHFLTGDDRYLTPMFAASQFGLGANPDNLSYVVGAGTNQVQWVLHEDSMKTHRSAPPGTIVLGPFDQRADYVPGMRYLMMWSEFFPVDEKMEPNMMKWPVLESYIDMWNYGSQNEYTPWQTMGRPAVVWAYMAAQLAKR